MGIKEVIKDSIPDRIKKFPNYRLFLVWASESGARNIDELKSYLEAEILDHKEWLRKNQRISLLGHKNRWLRAYAKYIDFLKSINKEFVKYL